MRAIKLIGALCLILALTAVAAATASAEVEFLPGAAGTTFTGASKKATLTAKNSKSESVGVTCSKSKAKGTLANTKEGTGDITFEECNVAGLAALSTGDAAKTILAHLKIKACTITISPLVGGVLLKLKENVKIEVPTTKLTVEVEGDVIGRLLAENTATKVFTLDVNAPEAKQEFTKCKDGAGEELTEELKAKVDAGTFLSATQQAEAGEIAFGVTETWMT